jgi:hydroxymethylpyrimidine/phosphomethylpyrimidine kinase
VVNGRKPAVALTVAGSDSGGGAGVQADLKTFEAVGVWGTCAITLVTAQNTLGLTGVWPVPVAAVVGQIDAVATDLTVSATKTGALGSAGIVEAVAGLVEAHDLGPLVVDPVLMASQGGRLLAPDALPALRRHLLPLATIVTPNLPEAALLLGRPIADRAAMESAAAELASMGPGAVLLKGGHLGGDRSPDLLWYEGQGQWLEQPRIPGPARHGTGCTLSAALTAWLALRSPLPQACARAKEFVTGAIELAEAIGNGPPPVNPGRARAISS